MRRKLVGLGVGLGLGCALLSAQPALGFVEDSPPTLANGGVEPNQTADPPAVAAAQKALAAFFEHTNREYSIQGYLNPRVMREELGNSQGDWLDKTMALACGRLVGGWHYMNWTPGKGWGHEAPPSGPNASVSCEYSPPLPGAGGVDPSKTVDPTVVGATQKALESFYRYTNQAYSIKGYANPQIMRELLGNEQTNWLDQSLALARGDLVGGWKNMNWVPGKGWCSCSNGLTPARSGGTTTGLTPLVPHDATALINGVQQVSQLSAQPIMAGSDRLVRIHDSSDRHPDDPAARQIMASLGVELGGEE